MQKPIGALLPSPLDPHCHTMCTQRYSMATCLRMPAQRGHLFKTTPPFPGRNFLLQSTCTAPSSSARCNPPALHLPPRPVEAMNTTGPPSPKTLTPKP
eukprot:356906-Chlamydomonas_euryale.AAC.2